MRNRVLSAAAAAMFMIGTGFADEQVTAGETLVAKRCKACHMIADGDNVILRGGRIGPNLFGVIGRRAGTLDGYAFGRHIVEAGDRGLVWTEAEVTTYLADPRAYLRRILDDRKARSNMAFKLKKADERAAVAAYLEILPEVAEN